MQEYKISEFAKALNLSTESLRHYERYEIIQPRRDTASGYRYYSMSEFNNLLVGKWMRSMDFSLSDIKQLLYSNDLDEYDKRCGEKEFELLTLIGKYQTKLEALHEFRQRVRSIKQKLGNFELEKTMQLVFHPCRNKTNIFIDEETCKLNALWMELLPEVRYSFVLPVSACESEPVFDDCLIGYSLPYRQALHNPKLFGTHTVLLPPATTMHTFFYIPEGKNLISALEEQVFGKIHELGCRICGAPYGHQVVRIFGNEEPRPYFEVWVPVDNL